MYTGVAFGINKLEGGLMPFEELYNSYASTAPCDIEKQNVCRGRELKEVQNKSPGNPMGAQSSKQHARGGSPNGFSPPFIACSLFPIKQAVRSKEARLSA